MRKTAFILIYILVCVRMTSAQNGWFQLNSGTSNYLNDIIFIGEDTGSVAADYGQLLITFNGGNNWIVKNLVLQPVVYLTSLYFFNSQTGFIASAGKIYKTTNSGFSIDNETGFIGGSEVPFDFAKTTYGGLNWDSFNFFQYVFDIQFKGKYGYAAGTYSTPVIFKTTN